MREILFRAKRKDNGEWVYGDLLKNIDCIKIREREKDITRIAKSYEVIPETVGQFTGLKDINGKKIFEGDILEEEPGYYFEVIWSVECAKLKLQWRTKAIQYPEWNRGVNMTVIGNIHDNKELFKDLMKKELKEKEE